MSKLLRFLKENGIEIQGKEVTLEEGKFFQDARPFFVAAFEDILEKKSEIYRDAVNKGVKVNISIEFPKEGKTEFNIKEQVRSFLEDLK